MFVPFEVLSVNFGQNGFIQSTPDPDFEPDQLPGFWLAGLQSGKLFERERATPGSNPAALQGLPDDKISFQKSHFG
jgi:hypothetical protein